MRALAYLEWRYAVHQIAAIVRSPLRLLLWIVYAATLGFFIYSRSFLHRHGSTVLGPGFSGMRPAALVGFYVGALGFTIARAAAGGSIFAFRNSAEAILFSNAGIRPLQIALWLQLRKIASSGRRFVTGGLYLFFIFAPHAAGLLANARLFAIVLLAIALEVSVDLPTFLLARKRLRRTILTIGCALAAAGFIFAGLTFAGPAVMTRTVAFLHFDPSAAAAALFEGNAFMVLAFLALPVASIVTVALLGDDALPELYAASVQTLASRSRRRQGRETRARFTASTTGSARKVPGGALTLVWKDWLGFRRGRFNLWFFFSGCAISTVFGAGIVLESHSPGDSLPLLSVAATAAIALILIAPFGASLGLANDLAKPLFWICRVPLRLRIAAWTFARTWRGAFAIGLAPFVAGVVAGNVALAWAAFPLAFAIFWSLQSLGVGLFAIFPNPIDSRGPMTLVRLVAIGASAVAPLVTAIVVTALGGRPLAAALASAGVFAAEGWLAIELASLRFAARGPALATLSRSG